MSNPIGFKKYLEQESYTRAAIELACLELVLDENLDENINGALSTLGIHVSKSKGLIDYVKLGGIQLGKLLIAGVQGDKEKIKKIGKNIKKEQILDFLLKLDAATLHFVTGPLHIIDAVLGWHIGADLAAAAKGANELFKNAIDNARLALSKLVGSSKTKKKIKNNIDRIEIIIKSGNNP